MEAEKSTAGRLAAAATRAKAAVRPSTGRTCGRYRAKVEKEVCAAFGRADGGAGLPWPRRPGGPPEENDVRRTPHAAPRVWRALRSQLIVHAAVQEVEELGGGGICQLALLSPHGDLSGLSGLVAAYGYRQLWECSEHADFPEVVVLVGTSEPRGESPADWEESSLVEARKKELSLLSSEEQVGREIRGKLELEVALCDERWET